MQTDILDKLFRVQATMEHLLLTLPSDEVEARYLRRALKIQEEAVKQVALLKAENPRK